ncbi:hypothetical protein F5X98DRAFT_384354 [Xylaria grammica]|nr:hypothetical protein F5X98DRAFT_384354 [Xylaria grammica]
MAEHAGTSYAERSRHDRRVELATLARDRRADMSVIVGLSWRVRGRQAHVDFTGALDTARLRQTLASLWSDARSHLLRARDGNAAEETGRPSVRGQPTSWLDALARAAPVRVQSPPGRKHDSETREAHRERIHAECERKMRDFAPVLASVDTLALAHLARDLLEQRRVRREADVVPLPAIGDPFFGSGHVFYIIRFPCDGAEDREVQWLVKIPAAAEDGTWDPSCCEKLRSEAFLLHLLRQEDVPVPEVIDADCRPDNEVGAPWLLMEFVRGQRLEEVWFGRDGREPMRGAGREQILRNVAGAMLKLGRFEFDTGGALLFDRSHGELVRTATGPLCERDVQAMVLRWFADEECASTPLYGCGGPWERTEDMYIAWLDTYPPDTVAERGVDGLLRLLLGLVREPGEEGPEIPTGGRGEGGKKMQGRKKFVLTHPDLSMRNILLAEDGTTIKAILGWDGARAAPRSIGNEALPRWLVRDFDPFVWKWKPPVDFWRPGHVPPEGNRFEDPPWVLRELREFYTGVVKELKGGPRGSDKRKTVRTRTREGGGVGGVDDDVDRENSNGDDTTDITKQSLLALTLDAAIRDPRCRTAALRRVLEKCSRSFEELDFDYFVETLGEGYPINAFKLKCLVKNVRELVDKGFVKGAVVW